MKKVIVGNHAVSWGVKLARAEVIAAYPITPQTQVVEELSEMCASGELPARFIKVESEHSAMAACLGAAAAGARTFTATSSQGLALMHELLHWAAGGRHPIVLANINRALGPGWNIWADQTDSLSQRDTGWIQLYCETGQEVLDTTIMAFRLAEQVKLPVMVVLDAFYLSHTAEPVDIPEAAQVDAFLPQRDAKLRLDPRDPRTFNALVRPDDYMDMRHSMQLAMREARTAFDEIEEAWERSFGRRYGAVEAYHTDDAELRAGSVRHHGLDRPPRGGSTAGRGRAGRAGQGEDVPAVPHGDAARGVTRRQQGGGAGPEPVARPGRHLRGRDPGGAVRRTAGRSPVALWLRARPRRPRHPPDTIEAVIERTRAAASPEREDLWVGSPGDEEALAAAGRAQACSDTLPGVEA